MSFSFILVLRQASILGGSGEGMVLLLAELLPHPYGGAWLMGGCQAPILNTVFSIIPMKCSIIPQCYLLFGKYLVYAI